MYIKNPLISKKINGGTIIINKILPPHLEMNFRGYEENV